jgi:spore germination protein KB
MIKMNRVKIGPIQLFCLMFMFELGSSIVVGVGLQAKQDAWLAIVLGMLNGIILYSLYISLFLQFPDQSLTTYIPKIVGKFVGIPLSFIYILYFFYIAARVLRDFGDLLTTSTLDNTPIMAINGLMILLIIYGLSIGIEAIGKTSEILFMILQIISIMGFILVFASGVVHTENLLPFLENGWKPVIKTVYTQTYTFPFGEMIAFTMILPLLNDKRMARKVGISAIVASGLALSFTIVMEISLIGVRGATESQFPLLEALGKVSIANFIQRLDIIVIATLILGVYIKITVFFYAGFLGFVELFQITKRKQKNYSLAILGVIILISSIKMASNFTEHIKVGLKWVPIYLHLPLQTGIPLLLLICVLIRKLFKRDQRESQKSIS